MTKLVAFAGPSRSGKGTVARVFAEECAACGLSSFERQLSDNGKWAAARIFRPTIRRAEAVAWFEELKKVDGGVEIAICEGKWGQQMSWWDFGIEDPAGSLCVSLREFLQHSLQDGGRDIFGENLWTDRLIPFQVIDPDGWGRLTEVSVRWQGCPAWVDGFFDEESDTQPTALAVISDLRQPNEAMRVQSLDGLVIELYRPDNEAADAAGADHVTEKRLPRSLVHHEIVNDGTLEELEAKARLLFYNHLQYWITSDASTRK